MILSRIEPFTKTKAFLDISSLHTRIVIQFKFTRNNYSKFH